MKNEAVRDSCSANEVGVCKYAQLREASSNRVAEATTENARLFHISAVQCVGLRWEHSASLVDRESWRHGFLLQETD